MLRNRKERIHTEVDEKFKLLFKIYIEKKYYYCGGNSGQHLRYYRAFYPGKPPPKYPEPMYEYCFICGWNLKTFKKPEDPFLWEPSEIFYIYEIHKYGYKRDNERDNDNIKIIGKCCINRFININIPKTTKVYLKYKLKTE